MSEFRDKRLVVTGETLGVDGGNSIGAAATYPDDIREELDRWRSAATL